MARSQPNVSLNEEQEAESQRIYERLRGAFDEELKTMARFMASQPNHQLFGQTEFELRDRVHELELGAGNGRRRAAKKGAGTRELAWSVRIVHATRGSSNGAASGTKVCWVRCVSSVVTIIVAVAAAVTFPGIRRWDWACGR